MNDERIRVTDAQLQDILNNENYGIECNEVNGTSIHALAFDLVDSRVRAKTAERFTKIEVLEQIEALLAVGGFDSDDVVDIIRKRIKELKAGEE